MLAPGNKSICHICNKGFCKPIDLSKHMPVHNEDSKSFKCEFCEQRFSDVMILRKHMLKHKGKVFTCEQCFTSFKA